MVPRARFAVSILTQISNATSATQRAATENSIQRWLSGGRAEVGALQRCAFACGEAWEGEAPAEPELSRESSVRREARPARPPGRRYIRSRVALARSSLIRSNSGLQCATIAAPSRWRARCAASGAEPVRRKSAACKTAVSPDFSKSPAEMLAEVSAGHAVRNSSQLAGRRTIHTRSISELTCAQSPANLQLARRRTRRSDQRAAPLPKQPRTRANNPDRKERRDHKEILCFPLRSRTLCGWLKWRRRRIRD